MSKQFEMERFAPVKTDRVQVSDYRFGHNEKGKLDVWIESSDNGKRFLWQVVAPGDTCILHTGIYTKNCYILSEKETGRYYFLDINDYGIWLFNENFFGSENYGIDESIKIQNWLASNT
jgi:hypothetical protein